MEGKFRRGVVHGRATYYLDNGTRYRHCHRHRHRLRHRFDFFRFMGLFRKGVPHGRAVVIAEDGSQVKVCNIAFLILFYREGGQKNCEKAVRLTAWVDPLFFCDAFPCYYFLVSVFTIFPAQVWEGSFYRGQPETQDLELELDTTVKLE